MILNAHCIMGALRRRGNRVGAVRSRNRLVGALLPAASWAKLERARSCSAAGRRLHEVSLLQRCYTVADASGMTYVRALASLRGMPRPPSMSSTLLGTPAAGM